MRATLEAEIRATLEAELKEKAVASEDLVAFMTTMEQKVEGLEQTVIDRTSPAALRSALANEEQLQQVATPPPNDLLPPRHVNMDPKRLRGGEERIPHRLQGVDRVLGREITVEQRDYLEQALALGAKVPPPRNGVSLQRAAFAPSKTLKQSLRDDNQLPLDDSDDEVQDQDRVISTLISRDMQTRKQAEKKKPVTVVKDMQEFLATQLAQKHNGRRVTAIGTMEMDDAAYRQTDWHFKSVCWIYATHDWGVAGAYHQIVMDRFNNGTLDPERYYESPACMSGNIEDCLVEMAYTRALHKPLGKKAGTLGSGAGSGAGTLNKVNQSDTLCSKHGKWYTADKKHTTATCKKQSG